MIKKEKTLDILTLGLLGLLLVFAIFLVKGLIPINNTRTYDKYRERLFDDSFVHEIDIFIEDMDKFFENAKDKEYVRADVLIDGERFDNVGLRTKGNNSLSLVEKYGLKRHSLKIEFDHFNKNTYHGLDKISLDSSFQDNAYMKNYMAMDMMRFMEIPTPLTSFAFVRINGEDYGLFLAMEEIEEGFARRNFGQGFGNIYKASYKSLNDENKDIKLIYDGNDFNSYSNFFENSKFPIDNEDKKRLIKIIEKLNKGEDLDRIIDVESVLRYFVILSFTVNLDSYFGHTAHNYFLYENKGKVMVLPWDFNLAFATYPLAAPNPSNDAKRFVNFPFITPNRGEIMINRPLYHVLMKDGEIFNRYRDLYDYFIREYFESGYFDRLFRQKTQMIENYVKKDPTAFISYKDYKEGVGAFYDFNKLRAASLRGQIDGNIPATIKCQRENPDLLLDVADLRIEDMGEVADLKDGYK